MSERDHIRIIRGYGYMSETRVYSPFEAKDDIKSLPDRRWDKNLKCWLIPNRDVGYAARLLRLSGWTVIVEDLDQTWSNPPRDRTAWVGECLAAVPAPQRVRVYRALALAFHPDHGGDETVMKVLTAEYAKYGPGAAA